VGDRVGRKRRRMEIGVTGCLFRYGLGENPAGNRTSNRPKPAQKLLRYILASAQKTPPSATGGELKRQAC